MKELRGKEDAGAMGHERSSDDREKRLRELASQTLEAYRSLNEAAARSAAKRQPPKEPITRAGKVLQEVLGAIEREPGRAS